MNLTQFERIDFKRMEQRAAQRLACSADQLCITVQQHQVASIFELRRHSPQALRLPHIVLIAQHDQLATTGTYRLLEIPRDAQCPGIEQHAQRDPRMPALRYAFRYRLARQRDRVVMRCVIREHDFHWHQRLQANTADLLTYELRTIARTERYRDGWRTGLEAIGAGDSRFTQHCHFFCFLVASRRYADVTGYTLQDAKLTPGKKC